MRHRRIKVAASLVAIAAAIALGIAAVIGFALATMFGTSAPFNSANLPPAHAD